MKYGVKLTIIDYLDYEELKNIAEAINSLGYKITIVDNGNFICEKQENAISTKNEQSHSQDGSFGNEEQTASKEAFNMIHPDAHSQIKKEIDKDYTISADDKCQNCTHRRDWHFTGSQGFKCYSPDKKFNCLRFAKDKLNEGENNG